jgi:hypothetical protein
VPIFVNASYASRANKNTATLVKVVAIGCFHRHPPCVVDRVGFIRLVARSNPIPAVGLHGVYQSRSFVLREVDESKRNRKRC